MAGKRPSWREASTPHYAQGDSFKLIERTRCRQCGWRLPPENRVFCGARCRTLYHTLRCDAKRSAFLAMVAEGL